MKTLTHLKSAAAALALLTGPAAAIGESRYVDVNSTNPTTPYTNWATAAVTIQDAVDVAAVGDEIVVTNGVYATGGRAVYGTMTNRVAVDKPLMVRSVNGPEGTVIRGCQVPGTTNGDGAIRCVYLTNGASLSGFTLSNGATRSVWNADGAELSGGGVWCASTTAVASNCVLRGNSAWNYGGGSYGGTLSDCAVIANLANQGGGTFGAVLSNCAVTGNSAFNGGGAAGGTLNNCTVISNSAYSYGGGAIGATLNICVLKGNSANEGGGAYMGVLNNCILAGNSANQGGGASAQGTMSPCLLNDCTLTNNQATSGGGVCFGVLSACTLAGNSASSFGGGALASSLKNCLLTGNSASAGGGANAGTLNNCTLVSNTASAYGGAFSANVIGGTPVLNNCILYFNTAPVAPNYDETGYSPGVLNYCCTAPLPLNGVGNITNEPVFVNAAAGNLRLGSGSACIDAGTNLSAIITNDLDGRPRPADGNADGIAAFDIGAYEHQVALVWQDSSNPAPPYASWNTAATNIQDAIDAALAGDEIVVTNGVYANGGRAVFGTMTNRVAVDKPVTVRSVNGAEVTIIQGAKAPGPVGTGPAAVRCAYLTNGAALYGFTLTNGATHAGGDTARERCGGGIWCASVTAIVSNCIVTSNTASYYGGGVYSGTLNACTIWRNSALSGGGACYGALYNCMLNSNSVSTYGGGAFSNLLVNCTLKGNSARYYGGGAYLGTLDNCLLLTNSVSDSYDGNGGGACSNILNGCTLRGNSAAHDGGGVYGGRVTNCTFIANSATYGGGASWSVLTNCTLTNNVAANWGGGVVSSTLKGCVVTGNGAPSGGGADDSKLVNCTVTANKYGGCRNSNLTNCIACFNYGSDRAGGFVSYCCTGSPLPSGVGNLTNAPLFVDYANGNLRLQSNSPCINAGRNACAPGGTDLDGNLRIVSGTVDIGAYEFQGLGSVISYAWLQQYGLPTDGSADSIDSDSDGLNNWQEWRCLTDPTNALSALRLLTASLEGTNVTVGWQAVAGVSYFLESSTNLAASPPFSLLATNLITNQSGIRTYNDTNTADVPSRVYRLGVAP